MMSEIKTNPIQDAIEESGVDSEAYRKAVVAVSNLIRKHSFVDAARTEVTLVLFPPSTPETNHAPVSYGRSLPVRRAAVPRWPTEKPLEDDLSSSGYASQGSQSSSNSTETPIKSTIPVCYASFNSCMTATKHCSGHGRCMKKFTVQDQSKDPEKAKFCFACKCMRTVLHEAADGKGGKSIYWGGAACQKKDVSSSFFLIAGGTIFFMSAVAWAIGLLYSIGEERLPGVLGAGVSGPKATK